MRPLKLLVGLVLTGWLFPVGQTLVQLMGRMAPDDAPGRIPPELLWFTGGVCAWVLLYALVPRGVRLYILGHELTHALWAWAMGGEVRNLKVGRRSGSVTVTRSNFWVMLAPYFFPLYTVLALLALGVASLFVDLTPYQPACAFGVGATFGFHLTFTLQALMHAQTDIQENGAIFSYSLILLINMLILSAGWVWVTPVTAGDWMDALRGNTAAAGIAVADWIGRNASTIFDMQGR